MCNVVVTRWANACFAAAVHCQVVLDDGCCCTLTVGLLSCCHAIYVAMRTYILIQQQLLSAALSECPAATCQELHSNMPPGHSVYSCLCLPPQVLAQGFAAAVLFVTVCGCSSLLVAHAGEHYRRRTVPLSMAAVHVLQLCFTAVSRGCFTRWLSLCNGVDRAVLWLWLSGGPCVRSASMSRINHCLNDHHHDDGLHTHVAAAVWGSPSGPNWYCCVRAAATATAAIAAAAVAAAPCPLCHFVVGAGQVDPYGRV